MREGVVLSIGEGLYELGLDDAGGPPREGFGGDAANTAVMAANMGASVRLIGRIGADALGRRLRAFWAAHGVGLDDLSVDPLRPTGIYVNRRADEGVHCFDYHRTGSAGSALGTEHVDAVGTDDVALTHFTGVGVAVSRTSAQACSALVRRTRATGGLISFAANVRPRLAPNLAGLRHAAATADLVFLSMEDAELLYGSADAAVIALMSTASELVITHGDRGARLHSGGETVTVTAPEIEAIDAAGAGDALVGAYLAARLDGEDGATALAHGVVAGALSCRAFGCAASYPTRDEVLAACS
jgi:2-dehydro-3-deoxygluconokinase